MEDAEFLNRALGLTKKPKKAEKKELDPKKPVPRGTYLDRSMREPRK